MHQAVSNRLHLSLVLVHLCERGTPLVLQMGTRSCDGCPRKRCRTGLEEDPSCSYDCDAAAEPSGKRRGAAKQNGLMASLRHGLAR